MTLARGFQCHRSPLNVKLTLSSLLSLNHTIVPSRESDLTHLVF